MDPVSALVLAKNAGKFALKNWKWFVIGGLALALAWTRHALNATRIERDGYEKQVDNLQIDLDNEKATTEGLRTAVEQQNAFEEARRIDEARTEQINGRRYADVKSMEAWLKELENAKPGGEVHALSPAACGVLRSLYGPEACSPSTDHH